MSRLILKLIDTDNGVVVAGGRVGNGVVKGEGAKHMVMEDLTLGGRQYADHVS